jgi:threonyl-tRNA synthetase
MIHRAPFGSLERFVGVLIEHFAGAFPVWLAPVQVVVLPIAERHADYAQEVVDKLRAADIRAELDAASETLNKRIRQAQTQKVPYMFIAGDREVEETQVSVRLRSGENMEPLSAAAAVDMIREKVAEKALV